MLLASEVLALAAIGAGYDAKQTEVHGVSQRGGSVYSHVRFGPVVHSPLVKPGEADVVVGLEKLEALRFAHFASPQGLIMVNDREIVPASVGPQAAGKYPHHAVEFLREKGFNVVVVPATDTATALGNFHVANVVMLGALSRYVDIPLEVWDQTLRQRIPERYLEINLRAFAEGREGVVVV